MSLQQPKDSRLWNKTFDHRRQYSSHVGLCSEVWRFYSRRSAHFLPHPCENNMNQVLKSRPRLVLLVRISYSRTCFFDTYKHSGLHRRSNSKAREQGCVRWAGETHLVSSMREWVKETKYLVYKKERFPKKSKPRPLRYGPKQLVESRPGRRSYSSAHPTFWEPEGQSTCHWLPLVIQDLLASHGCFGGLCKNNTANKLLPNLNCAVHLNALTREAGTMTEAYIITLCK